MAAADGGLAEEKESGVANTEPAGQRSRFETFRRYLETLPVHPQAPAIPPRLHIFTGSG